MYGINYQQSVYMLVVLVLYVQKYIRHVSSYGGLHIE